MFEVGITNLRRNAAVEVYLEASSARHLRIIMRDEQWLGGWLRFYMKFGVRSPAFRRKFVPAVEPKITPHVAIQTSA
jgi:hypothetical protein